MKKLKTLETLISKKGISKMQFSRLVNMSPADMYQMINGKKCTFPAWRRRICQVLEMEEKDVFPELLEVE